jgi:hypothetical protein
MASVLHMTTNVLMTGEAESPAELSELCCLLQAELENSTEELTHREDTRKKEYASATPEPGGT